MKWNSLEPGKIRMIIFDIDGTLAESDEYLVDRVMEKICKVFPKANNARTAAFIRNCIYTGETIGSFGYRFLDLLGLDPIISKWHEKVSGEKVYKYEAVEGLFETLEELHKHYRLAVVTCGGKKSTNAFLEKFHLENMFDVVVTAHDCKYIKPSSCPIKTAMKQADRTPVECVMVGDTILDVISAHRAGIPCISVMTGFDGVKLLQMGKTDKILPSIASLPELFCGKPIPEKTNDEQLVNDPQISEKDISS